MTQDEATALLKRIWYPSPTQLEYWERTHASLSGKQWVHWKTMRPDDPNMQLPEGF